jgi:hypothetical protein
MAEFFFESLQMDLRSRAWPRMYRLGIWINVNVYLFVWVNSKSSIEHLFIFHVALKTNLLFDVRLDE